MSYITAIGTANPANRFSQSIIAEFMLRAMKLDNGDSRKLRTIFRASGIQFRHSVLDDYGKVKGFSFYPDTLDLSPFPGTEKRLHIFRKHALSLSVAAFHDMLSAYPGFDVHGITHVIAVCCTGMYAPGLDVELVNTLRLPSTVQRTAINFMGCHASFNALKVADALCRSNARAKVLIVCTELCSLHFQRMGTEDNLLANALFADGSAAVLVEGHTAKLPRLKLEDFHSDLAPEGESDMAWVIGDLGFQMRLSSYVPALIKKGVSPLIKVLLEKTSTQLSAIQHYAIHPGGKRILEVIEVELGIDKSRNYAAYDILKNFGNMSSPTVLFVLNKIFRSLNGGNNGERVLSVAFGPGLTLESMILRVETPADHA